MQGVLWQGPALTVAVFLFVFSPSLSLFIIRLFSENKSNILSGSRHWSSGHFTIQTFMNGAAQSDGNIISGRIPIGSTLGAISHSAALF